MGFNFALNIEAGGKVAELEARHRSIMRTLLGGKSEEFVADLFNINIIQLQEIVGGEMFKSEMGKMQKELDEKVIEIKARELMEKDPDKILKEATQMAAAALRGALTDENVHGRVKASIEILNRSKEAKAAAGEKVEPTQGFKDMMNRAMEDVQKGEHVQEFGVVKVKEVDEGENGGSKRVLES